MPILKQCSYRNCIKIVDQDTKYCEYHAKRAAKEEKERYRVYQNKRRHDAEQKVYQDFYSSSPWLNLSETIKRHFFGMCVICWVRNKTNRSKINECSTTHHIEELSDRYDLRLDEDNLICLCSKCHQRTHVEYNNGEKEKEQMKKILYSAVEKFNEEYY
ncbi:HNH endonuclease [Inconstantimicrobium mannanitabidum]|uniref:HNH endonuclease n=1 Tax=Inconstantimicrobium mannanitabidum TaxID=1604901 RepID=A0ACB5R9C1_9CLOT|nr:HNH endonuclease [Clostridium sp. TW13]GKX65636.1 HNH endonuclease [Clostridium sp. TW13]